MFCPAAHTTPKKRAKNSVFYRFNFNGQERDDEVYGAGNAYSFEYRVYDPRLGRFLSVDPLTKNYPWFTPYQFSANMPIACSDVEGLEGKLEIYSEDGQIIKTVTFDNPGILGNGKLGVHLHYDLHDNIFYGERIDGSYRIIKSWQMDVSIDKIADYKTWLNVKEFVKEENSSIQKNVQKANNDLPQSATGGEGKFRPLDMEPEDLRIIDGYGARGGSHKGYDIVEPEKGAIKDKPLYAPFDGVVVRNVTKPDGDDGGVRVRIKASDGSCYVMYCHMIEGSNSHLIEGKTKVNKGDYVGKVGSTGTSTGPHLHIETWGDGKGNSRPDPAIQFPIINSIPQKK